ncbi:MAG: alpha/beta hydrolase [Chloroflexi bacterium]|nr:alpha/beta hydrolase [Chloroflexota bacterium]
MSNLRTYGNPPFRIAVLHGGPGAPGEMAPVARELAAIGGVLEPLQTAQSIEGQVAELHTVLAESGNPPVTLIGWSWGAMLGFIFAAQHPSLVSKLILVSSGVYEEKYAENIMPTRLGRLSEGERAEVQSLLQALDNPAAEDKNTLMARLGRIIAKADSYDPLPDSGEAPECNYDTYQCVWQQATALRKSGELLALGKKIRCPVVAIHGDYDPHPFDGVKVPLSGVLKDFRFILLRKCGHCPWRERQARGEFYRILEEEIGQ